MTMMITKFHKLIQNKVIWALFLLLVVFSFVIWGTQIPDADDIAAQQSVAELHGKPVSPETYRQHKLNTYLALVRQIGQAIPYGQIQEEIEPMAWRRMIGLETAAKLQMIATDGEVRTSLAQQPVFAENGQFSKAKYQNYVRNAINRALGMRISTAGFEDHVREEITLHKLQDMVQQTVLLLPYELKRRYRIYNDIYSADVAILRSDDVSNDVRITDEEAKAFFDEDPTRFMIPPKRTIQYFSLPVATYIDGAEVTEQQIQDYYERNQDEYAIAVTNEPDAAVTNEIANTTNELDVTESEVTHQPLEEVQDDIRSLLALESARFKASSAAMDLVESLAPDRDGNALTTKEASEKHNLEIQTAGPYGENEVADQFGILGREVVEQAWLLTPEPNESFSNPIEDRDADHVYVIVLAEELPSRVPEYDEVKDMVLVQANERKIEDTLVQKAQDLAEQAENLGDSTNTMATLAQELGYEVQTLHSVNLSTGLVDNAYADTLVETFVSLAKGEVSDPIKAENAWLVVHVRDLISAEDNVEFENYQSQISDQFARQIGSYVFADWQEQLLRNADFTERNIEEEEEEEEEEDANDEVEDPTNPETKNSV